jgi:hypothetical protein
VSNNWLAEYSDLRGLISGHPEITIEDEYVCLPDEIRTEFYVKFNAIRSAIIEEQMPAALLQAGVLSSNYLLAESEACAWLQIDEISLPPLLDSFMHHPIEGLRGALYDPLFEFLKGRIDSSALEQIAAQNTKKLFQNIYQKGYEKWVILSLVTTLQADRIYGVEETKVKGEEAAHLMFRRSEDQIPSPVESRLLKFKDDLPVRLVVPDFIIHSASLNRYISIRSMLSKPMALTSYKPQERQWLPTNNFTGSWAGMTLIYLADSPEELALIADRDEVCQPDLILNCRSSHDWHQGSAWKQIQTLHNFLSPVLGSLIVTSNAMVDSPEDSDGINLLTVGFDKLKLAPVTQILGSQALSPI